MSESLRRIWFWPLVLALFTSTGLVSALFSDGFGDAFGDAWAWIALSIPLAAIAWGCARSSPR
jgi:hypothetical protein